MQKKILLRIGIMFLLALQSLRAPAQLIPVQQVDYASTKEKIYIQSSHVFFKSGETVYFKIYVVRGEDQTITRISNVVYAELISPSGTQVMKASYPVKDGYAEGSFDFTSQMPGGIYKIRAWTSWMQNEKESTYFIKELTVQQVIAPRILMKLDFPEKGYGPGSTVKASFSMRSLTDEPIANYYGKYTVSLGGKEYTTQSFKTDYLGKAMIFFDLPAGLATNDGLLNIRMEYNGYTESISRSIPIVLNNIDLQFMPEGGTLVQGITSTIAFKALNENGKAADVSGEIRDQEGNTVTRFDSYHFGMGRFRFTPEQGKLYKAFITSPAGIAQTYNLPVATTEGIVMNITKANKQIEIILSSTTRTEVKLKGSFRNTTYFLQKLSLHKGENKVKIDESVFPTGIAQFTLYTADELPLAERLVFTNEEKNLQVKISFDKAQYIPREKVTMNLQTLDENGQPVASNLSVAVMDDKLWTYADDKQNHILSWLLLSSELKGNIEEPQFYFKKEEPKAVPALDLLMLTQGYRYFDYTEYITRENSLQYLPDQDRIVSGQVVNEKNEPVPARVFLLNNVTGGKAMDITTGSTGLFFFSNLEENTSYYVFAQALNKRQRITINLLQVGLGYNPLKAKLLKPLLSHPGENLVVAGKLPVAEKKKENEIVRDLKSKPVTETPIDGRPKALSEVVVVGYGVTRQSKMIGYSVVTVRGNNFLAGPNLQNGLAGKVPGLQISTSPNGLEDTRLSLRGIRSLAGNSQPLLVVNGLPMQMAALAMMNPDDIESVTILKDAAATALYGPDGVNGALLIESKKNRRESVQIKFSNRFYYSSRDLYTTGNKYTYVKTFYAPLYTTTQTEERNDFRETIYWNGVVQTDKEGQAKVEFYNSDASTTFRAIAEGIGYNGKPGRAEATYAVQNALQLDIKIPPYLTVGDKALLPLVIRNNTGSRQELSLDVLTPVGFVSDTYDRKAVVDANASKEVLIPVQAQAATNGQLVVTVSGPSGKEVLTLNIQAADKGFPIRMVFSGNQSARHDFNLSKLIPGTLNTQLRIFKDLEGQLTDGIESMLREPYGCFEQTSSATYPNIMVLRYLKESGKARPEIEKRALALIETGYKRLIGFETKENGFEWFGHTPAHEALTAYGLLEFTDMKEFIQVDEKMLERTKNFLLKRRNGKGGFKIVSGGYDRFASVPGKIANIYIVYALTRAGLGKEIQEEYKAAVEQALKSNDGYQLAMMALAAHSAKDKGAYKDLMERLDKIMTPVGDLPSETSVVNSRDASLRVETRALYAMALMKDPQPDLVRISKLISGILGEKSYYGYGSTQGTVLALQALSDYTKLMGNLLDAAPVNFMINGQPVTELAQVSKMVQEGGNRFEVQYTNKDKAVPYSMEVSYSTLTPPTSEKAELKLATTLAAGSARPGETVRMDISVTNTKGQLQPMAVAKIGIPAGLAAQPWQLKEIMEKNQAAYYEIFDNYLVFYWMGFAPGETKTISLDLKAEVPGTYTAKASNVYLYYTPEYKYWNEGLTVTIGEQK